MTDRTYPTDLRLDKLSIAFRALAKDNPSSVCDLDAIDVQRAIVWQHQIIKDFTGLREMSLILKGIGEALVGGDYESYRFTDPVQGHLSYVMGTFRNLYTNTKEHMPEFAEVIKPLLQKTEKAYEEFSEYAKVRHNPTFDKEVEMATEGQIMNVAIMIGMHLTDLTQESSDVGRVLDGLSPDQLKDVWTRSSENRSPFGKRKVATRPDQVSCRSFRQYFAHRSEGRRILPVSERTEG